MGSWFPRGSSGSNAGDSKGVWVSTAFSGSGGLPSVEEASDSDGANAQVSTPNSPTLVNTSLHLPSPLQPTPCTALRLLTEDLTPVDASSPLSILYSPEAPPPSPTTAQPIPGNFVPIGTPPQAQNEQQQADHPPLPEGFLDHPPCTAFRFHPHQYFVLPTTNRSCKQWRPLHDLNHQDYLSHIPTTDQLARHTFTDTFTTTFHAHIIHTFAVEPSNAALATEYNLTPFGICSNVGIYALDADFPLRHIAYIFNTSLFRKLLTLPAVYHPAYEGSFCLSIVHDFLDGCLTFAYSYLHFEENSNCVSLHHYSTYMVDTIHFNPQLLHFCFMPCIPPNPLKLIERYRLETIDLVHGS
ncbi:hypothetical protein F5148DRAFT_1292212 [Russula earlei]|uniref:Uncharacterized protein n=1 Tax=Russula earlei TaxID=71964 RepID=A0ACC0TV57_9AGAM|nr:hypothetical protein F5148DRAFT_1292212 [Russula earlei]